MVKTDITLLTIEARGWAGALFRRTSRNDGDILSCFNRFIEIFYQLYLSFKYNAEPIKKIEDWKKKQKFYDDLFYNKIAKGEIPSNILNYFDAFLSDMVNAGIYNLSQTEFEERQF